MHESVKNNYYYIIVYSVHLYSVHSKVVQSPKFKRVLLDETPKFPFWGLNICVDFDLRGSKKNEKYEETQ